MDTQEIDELNAFANDWTWVQRSANAEDLSPRFGFRLQDKIRVRDPGAADAINSPSNSKPIRLPGFARQNALVATAEEAEGHEDELAEYYETLLQLTGRPLSEQEYNFWLDLRLHSDQAHAEIPFLPWDRASQLKPFSSWLATGADGSTFNDLDQGWQVKAKRLGNRLHLQHSGFDQGGEYANVQADLTQMRARVSASEAALERVVDRLADIMKINPWT